MVVDFIQEIQVPKAEKAWLHFTRIDNLASFDKAEGILFLATPDVLAGLTTWAFSTVTRPTWFLHHSVPAVALL